MPTGIPVIETFLGFPSRNRADVYKFLAPHLRDEESKGYSFPAQYMFKDVPANLDDNVDPLAVVLDNLDRFGIERGMISVGPGKEDAERAMRDHPDRFIPSISVDPNDGVEALRAMTRAYETYGIKAVTTFAAGAQVAINDKRYYPIYAKCCELDIPIFSCAGIPGPRVPFESQKVEHIDEVCWFFPELTFVTRHGCEPWTGLAVKLMLKWPNLYYSTSAFAPRHYPKAIIDYANTRGADKIIYAGYFPMGLSLERIVTELKDVPFADPVWPKFLRGNAARVLGLDA